MKHKPVVVELETVESNSVVAVQHFDNSVVIVQAEFDYRFAVVAAAKMCLY